MKALTALTGLCVTLALVAFANGDDKNGAHHSGAKHPGLEQFKLLAGEWVGKELSGMHAGQEVRVRYKVTAAGSTVVETIMPDSDHEMVTMIHPDGADLVLTHYCMLGNQPEMKAKGKTDGHEIAFKFVRAGNMSSDKDMHMHEATYKFVDKDTLQTEWVLFQGGKAAEKVVFELKRKK